MESIEELKEDIKNIKNFKLSAVTPDTGIIALITIAIKTFIYAYCETIIYQKKLEIDKLEKDFFEKNISDKEKDKIGKIKL